MFMRLGKFILIFFIICLIGGIIYYGVNEIIGDDKEQNGTFVYGESLEMRA